MFTYVFDVEFSSRTNLWEMSLLKVIYFEEVQLSIILPFVFMTVRTKVDFF